ncbi:unnamed protein product [Ascophyllum nodosum]
MAGKTILAPAIFLIAVNGLLSLPPQHRMRRQLAPPASIHKCTARQRETFDGRPWDDTTGGTAAQAVRRRDDDITVNVDVDKLPTFAIFTAEGERGWRREDVIGGSDAAACRVRLLAAIALVPRPAAVRERHSERSVENAALDDGVEVEGNPPENQSAMETTTIANEDVSKEDSIMNVSSRQELVSIMKSLRGEHEPFVVMYHAPWCRTCAYLTPMFLRLARQRRFEGANRTRFAPIFCRVDVSKWGAPYTSERISSTSPTSRQTLLKGPKSDRERGVTQREAVEPGGDDHVELLHEDSTAMENCTVCGKSGFVPCGTCKGKGAVARSSPDGKHSLAVTCPACVGYKRLRCPSCGGKCYMCD